MDEDFAPDSFEAEKLRSFVQVLFKAARLANERALGDLRAATGQQWVRPAHTNLFPHISFDGIRLTELASRLGVTKQAAQALVDDLMAAGAVERVPDPEDGRAKLIRWSAKGRRGLSDGLGFLFDLERELAEVVGPEDLAIAHRVLVGIVDHLTMEDER